MKYLIVTILILNLMNSLHASDWWNHDWDYRKEFIINTTSDGLILNSPQGDVAVLVKLHVGNFSYFTDVGVNAEDVRFVSEHNQLLAHNTEYFDFQQQVGLFWVKIPKIYTDSHQKFYMYYGAGHIEDNLISTETYSEKDILVYHFNEELEDSTSHANNPNNESISYVQGAAIGAGVRFQGDEHISISPTPVIDVSSSRDATISFWSKIDVAQEEAVLINLSDENDHQLTLKIHEQQLSVDHTNPQAQTSQLIQLDKQLELNSWYHLVISVNAEEISVYVNSDLYAIENSISMRLVDEVTIGANRDGSNPFIGQMDELHIQEKEAVQDWVSLAYVNQGPNDVLISAGVDGQNPSLTAAHNPLMFSISKLSLEGKITTIVLAFMLMLGLNVMLVKSLYVRRVKKANALFSERFPTQMFKPVEADNSSISDSSLNNIHREAIKELSRRIEQGDSISTNAIVTIRSCMNAAMLRETQKLNKQMVLLTIAIAGGPFIGLLGTVMGVMITFADVALAGTVDVNAIAPGISAALVATVAGLLVAIPCLFGYNYLSAQIKEIVGDMRVFVDQFQASIAEHYSE